jgi:Transposase DDE domain
MPHKYNTDRRHHIPRARYKVTNWKAYEAGLRQRGSLTIWFSEEAVAAWRAAPRTTPGGQARYSDLAIETSLILRTVFHQPLRQTEGLVGSLLELMGLDLPVPDHSTLSRRSRTLAVSGPDGERTGAPAGRQHRGEAQHLSVQEYRPEWRKGQA